MLELCTARADKVAYLQESPLCSLPAACSADASVGLSNGCFLGMTNSALPAAYSTPSGLSLTVACTHVLRPSIESSDAVHMICEPAGIGCRQIRL